jgi:3-methyladenine DNA glycosylase AlkD
MATTKTPKKPAAKKSAKAAKAPAARMTLAEVMRILEKSGTAQTKKTYLRHGAKEPMFGVLFAKLKELQNRIGVDHELAHALFDTGNFDAQNLAMKIVDPARMSSADLDRWARCYQVRMCGMYMSALAAEGPHASSKAVQWLASKDEGIRCAAWGLVGQMACRDEMSPDSWFSSRLAEIERTIHEAPNSERAAMNMAVIQIGGRNAALRKAALAAAKRIGTVHIDHGDTSCKTPEAPAYIEKMWAFAGSKKFESPAAQERNRESPRTRC